MFLVILIRLDIDADIRAWPLYLSQRALIFADVVRVSRRDSFRSFDCL